MGTVKCNEIGISETKKAKMLRIQTFVKLPCSTRVGGDMLCRAAVRGNEIDVPPIHRRNHEQVKDKKDAGCCSDLPVTHLIMKVGTGNKKCN